MVLRLLIAWLLCIGTGSPQNAAVPVLNGLTPPATCFVGESFFDTDAPAGSNIYGCTAPNTWTLQGGGGGGGGLPAGAIILITAGTCPTGFAEAIELNGVMVRGTLAANADVGTTAGSDTITPAGSFTGDAATLTHSGTAVANHSFTQPAIAWPVGVPTNSGGAVNAHSGTAVADHASHTHTYTDVIAHTHTQAVNSATTGGLSGYTPDTSTNTSTTSGYSTGSTGIATGTTAGPSATLTHSVTQPANHTFTQPTIAWPVGVPTNSGGAVDAHAVTQPNSHSYTPTGVFAGTQFDNRPAYLRVIFCKKT